MGVLISESVGDHWVSTAQTKFDNATTHALQVSVAKLEAAIADLDTRLAAIPDNATFQFHDQSGNVVVMSAHDVKAIWNNFDFVVSDSPASLNRGGSDAVDNSTGRITDTFNYKTIYDQFAVDPASGQTKPSGYSEPHDGSAQTGMLFILLHEIGHDTASSIAGNHADFVAAGSPTSADAFAQTSFFAANERFANDFARYPANSFHWNINMHIEPTFGF